MIGGVENDMILYPTILRWDGMGYIIETWNWLTLKPTYQSFHYSLLLQQLPVPRFFQIILLFPSRFIHSFPKLVATVTEPLAVDSSKIRKGQTIKS
jgi:hypothetical protein